MSARFRGQYFELLNKCFPIPECCVPCVQKKQTSDFRVHKRPRPRYYCMMVSAQTTARWRIAVEGGDTTHTHCRIGHQLTSPFVRDSSTSAQIPPRRRPPPSPHCVSAIITVLKVNSSSSCCSVGKYWNDILPDWATFRIPSLFAHLVLVRIMINLVGWVLKCNEKQTL